jgi:hypothetical protein
MAAGYNWDVWRDHVVEFPTRFIEVTQGQYTFETPEPGEIIQQGTPQNAVHFNNMEQGIVSANEKADWIFNMLLQTQRDIKSAVGQIGTVTLGNAQTYPFNNSGATIPLVVPRDTTDYAVLVEVVSETGGSAGTISTYNKLLNGFGIKFDGSASSITVHYIVIGGGI